MSFEILKTIITAEDQADMKLNMAAVEAKKILAEAEAEGRQLILTAEAEAESAVEIMMSEAELKITVAIRDISIRTSEESSHLQKTAQSRIPQAVNRVVERIVSD